MGAGAVDAVGVGGAAGLRVFAAGMLRPGFDGLDGLDGLGGIGRVEYANARDLAERIVGGEEVDVFASASPVHPVALRAAGVVGEVVAFASNSLVVAVPAASKAADYEVLRAAGTRVVIEVEGIPLGDYTRELLGKLDEVRGSGFADAVFGNVVVEVETVFEVGAALVEGRADAGILYRTDVAARPGELRAIELPEEAEVRVTCVACVVCGSRRAAEAAAWVEELVGPRGQAVLREAGFGRPPVG